MSSESLEAELAIRTQARCGEGPVFDADTGLLHWVDVLSGAIHSSDTRSGITTTITLPTLVGAALPRRAGGFVAAISEGFVQIAANGTAVRRLNVLGPSERMNDGKCDATGRLWAGSTDRDFAAGRGRLWVLDSNWNARVILGGLTLPNGLGWSPDMQTFYLIDSIERAIYAFDCDLNAPALTGRRSFHQFGPDEGLPDGLCVDAAGDVWVAMYGAGHVLKLDRDGSVQLTLSLPVSQPTSCTLEGTGPADLWITSARDGLEISDDDPAPDGSLYVVRNLPASAQRAAVFAG